MAKTKTGTRVSGTKKTGTPRPSKNGSPAAARGKGKGRGKRPRISTTTIENAVAITNVDAGENIPLTFDVAVSCTNNSGAKRDLVAGCGGATVTPAAVSVADGTTVNTSFTLTHATAGTGHAVTAQLQDPTTGLLFASDTVSPVTVVESTATNLTLATDPPLTIDTSSTTLNPTDPSALPAAGAVSGTYDTTQGNNVTLIVEDPALSSAARGGAKKVKRRRPVTFTDTATLDPHPIPGHVNLKRWNHAHIPGAAAGQHLRVILTQGGAVKAIVRGIFS